MLALLKSPLHFSPCSTLRSVIYLRPIAEIIRSIKPLCVKSTNPPSLLVFRRAIRKPVTFFLFPSKDEIFVVYSTWNQTCNH